MRKAEARRVADLMTIAIYESLTRKLEVATAERDRLAGSLETLTNAMVRDMGGDGPDRWSIRLKEHGWTNTYATRDEAVAAWRKSWGLDAPAPRVEEGT